MADDTQGKVQQKDAGPGQSGSAAVAKGTAVADARDRATLKTRAAEATKLAETPVAKDERDTAEEIAKRDPVTYKALERGYVDGKIVEEGETFVTKADKGLWMEKVKKGDAQKYGVDLAVEEAGYAKKADVDYEGMSEAGLEALAALVGVSKPGALKKDELIQAIKSARRVDAQ